MFGLFKKEKSDVFTAPVTGQLMPLDTLNDGVFSEKMMGEGYAIAPEEQAVYAPIVVIFTNMDKVKDFSPIKAGPVTHGDAVTTLTYAG